MKNNDMNAEIGRWLRHQRELKGMSQQDVADRLGTTRTAVHYWEPYREGVEHFSVRLLHFVALQANKKRLPGLLKTGEAIKKEEITYRAS